MPELPEVEVIVQELRKKIVGEVIEDIDILWHRSWIDVDRHQIIHQEIKNITRKGKYIIIHLTTGYLMIHLRMTGQLIVNGDSLTNIKHLRTIFKFKSGNEMLFFDARKFGRIVYSNSPHAYLKKIGIDAIDKQFTVHHLKEIMQKRKLGLKKFFLTQTYVSGLGNIYIDETLFYAGLHPLRFVNTLSDKEIEALHKAIQTVLTNAIKSMGTTISDYKTTGGGFGKFQNKLNVYGRTDLPCVNCTNPIQKTRVNNRGTHYCPSCQPE